MFWSDRVQAGEAQRGAFVEAVHNVERLYRLPGCPLQHIGEPDEVLLAVVFSLDLPHLFLGERLVQKNVAGGENATHHFDRSRGKVDARVGPELLQYFR